MQRVFIKDLQIHLDKEIAIKGWFNNLRAFGKLNFLILRDKSGLTQVVIQDKDELNKISQLQPGSILSIRGKVVTSNSDFGVEIVDPKIDVIVPIKEVPPLEYYKPEMNVDLEFNLDHRPIALRNRQIQAVFKIQAELAHAYRLYMHDQVNAVEYFAPNLIGASSEGGAEFFNVDYFGHTATLAQSSQLYKQIMVGVNERVFALMPFFRAENSNTTRHLTEGKQLEFEFGFFDHWHEIMDIQENAIKFIVEFLHKTCEAEIKTLGGTIITAPQHIPFPRLTFAQAQELYFKRSGIDERHEPDLSPAAEKELCKYAIEEHGTDLIFITDWKTSKRPFYSFPTESNPELTNTFDLLCAGTEITSGGQRRHTYDSMVEGILSKGMDPANFTDYLSIFKYGMPPHGGFGMGLERLTMTMLKLKNIRETSLFPSDPKRIAGNKIKSKIFFGSENIRNEIIRLIKTNEFDFQHVIHEHSPSAPEAEKISALPANGGIKALILKGKSTKKNYQFNIPSSAKLDMKSVATITGEKCEFEDPIVIEERFGLKVGGVPPFGSLLNLDTFFDEKITQIGQSSFSCGLATESIVLNAKDLVQLVQPKIASFTKE